MKYQIPENNELELRKRAEKYFNIEKGPKRHLIKKDVNGNVLFCFPNGICTYKAPDDQINTNEAFKNYELIENNEYTVIKLKEKHNGRK